MCLSACLIQNSSNWKDFDLVLLFQIKWEAPVPDIISKLRTIWRKIQSFFSCERQERNLTICLHCKWLDFSALPLLSLPAWFVYQSMCATTPERRPRECDSLSCILTCEQAVSPQESTSPPPAPPLEKIFVFIVGSDALPDPVQCSGGEYRSVSRISGKGILKTTYMYRWHLHHHIQLTCFPSKQTPKISLWKKISKQGWLSMNYMYTLGYCTIRAYTWVLSHKSKLSMFLKCCQRFSSHPHLMMGIPKQINKIQFGPTETRINNNIKGNVWWNVGHFALFWSGMPLIVCVCVQLITWTLHITLYGNTSMARLESIWFFIENQRDHTQNDNARPIQCVLFIRFISMQVPPT